MKSTENNIIEKLTTAKGLLDNHEIFDEVPKVSEKTIRQWAKDGVIPSIRLGGRIFFKPSAVRQHIAENLTRRPRGFTAGGVPNIPTSPGGLSNG